MFDVASVSVVLLFVIGPARCSAPAAACRKWPPSSQVGRTRAAHRERAGAAARGGARDRALRITRAAAVSRPARDGPPQAEPTSIPPDPYTPEAQHGHGGPLVRQRRSLRFGRRRACRRPRTAEPGRPRRLATGRIRSLARAALMSKTRQPRAEQRRARGRTLMSHLLELRSR